jgi:UDP-glucose 4-epimerase
MADYGTVLVTGANGMLGSHIVDRLVGRGAHVLALDMAPPQPHYSNTSPAESVTSIVGDITDPATIVPLIERTDAVVHVAAVLSKAEGDPPGPLMAVNVAGTHTIFQAAAAAGKKVVFASSGSIYGPNRRAVDGAAPAPFVESDPPHDLGFYALSKHVNELYADAFARTSGLEWVAMRLGAMYGSRLRQGLTTRFLLSVPADLEAGRVPVVDGDPNSGLDWVHVEDAAECIVRALNADVSNTTINVSTGLPARLEDIVLSLLRTMGAPTDIQWTGAAQPNGRFSSARYYDSTKSGELLGFRPSQDTSVGMRAYVDWRASLKGA